MKTLIYPTPITIKLERTAISIDFRAIIESADILTKSGASVIFELDKGLKPYLNSLVKRAEEKERKISHLKNNLYQFL